MQTYITAITRLITGVICLPFWSKNMFPNDMQLPRIAEKVKYIILSLYHISDPLITTLFVGLIQ